MFLSMNAASESLRSIELILKKRIGLEPSSLGPNAVECAVADRMRLLGFKSIRDYAATISEPGGELEALIDLVVVPETWFFRDREPFVYLVDFLVSEYKPGIRKTLRILSAPCASGEEPYSIAMTCLDCGLKEHQFVIDAADINARSLDKAQAAVYGPNSFRGADLAFRDRHFTRAGTQFSLKPDVRRCVRFFKANILDDDFRSAAPPYDVAFCRNLLIYLHEEARAKTIAAFDRLLVPGGLLFIGHAEINSTLLEGFEPVKHHGAFALRKRAQKKTDLFSSACRCCATARIGPDPAMDSPVHIRARPENMPSLGSAAPSLPRPDNGARNLKIEHATRLADEGKLDEAAEICRAALRSDQFNAKAHFLMGLIEEARGGNAAAAECFSRAIYLETGFSDAILHLAMLKEQCGDTAGAERLRRRATALKPGGLLTL